MKGSTARALLRPRSHWSWRRILRDVAGWDRIRPGIAAVVASSDFFMFAAALSALITVV